jgi:F0F1-type ATP synthase membrane subunit b/b'
MPQFDFYSFSGQIFWTLAGFYFFYFFGLYYYLPKFAAMFKIRQKLIMTYIKENKTASSAVNTLNSFLSF